MSRDELAIEAEIRLKGLNAPRLTPADIDAAIVGEDFHVFPGTTLTVCCLKLRNGFVVTGESAAASPENFDREIGRKVARDQARNKIWPLEGYLLKERLSLLPKSGLLDFAKSALSEPFETPPHIRRVAEALERVASGDCKRLIINMPPRHGMTTLLAKVFIPWFMGKNTVADVDSGVTALYGTHSDDLAAATSRAVCLLMGKPYYRSAYPDGVPQANFVGGLNLIELSGGSYIFFVGRGDGIAGRGADLIVIDDPIKNSEEAASKDVRDSVWEWFSSDVRTRLNTEDTPIVIGTRRWHEDDLVGRLTNPNNPQYDADEAAQWTVINMPALSDEGTVLWPDRFPYWKLDEIRVRDPRGFSALFQGRPLPELADAHAG